jgi:adenine-specific DNA-methyltransferase
MLKARLQPVCKRTLRRQVLPYVRYTKRLPIMQPFTPDEREDRLYHLVSEYLQRGNLQALPASQRSLMTLVLRKLLASSTFAIAGALESLSRGLRAHLQQTPEPPSLEEELTEDFEALDAIAEEWNEEETTPAPLSASERTALEREVTDLEHFRELAVSITNNAKGVAPLTSLQTTFAKAETLGAARKALVFTESRRTQA